MKILITNHFPLVGSGSGVYITNIAKCLANKGHEVCIIMPENTTSKIPELKKIKLHPVFFKYIEDIEGQLDFNFPCMDPHPRSDLLFNNMTQSQIEQYEKAFRTAIEEEIETFKPDIIHAQHIWIISGLLKNYKIPYIITSHGAEFITYKKTNIFDEYGINAVEGCNNIITISKDNTEEIVNKFSNIENKLLYIRNGYNSQDFYCEELNKKQVLTDFGIDKEFDKIILFVGRISKMKGLDILLKAAKIYEKEHVLTLIAGDGKYRDELCVMIKQLGLKNIVFLGSKNADELRKLYNISDVLVLPSRKEALPLVAIEALACGTPAIVANQGGMTDIINKDLGLIFDVDDDKMLAKQINMILNNEIVFDKDKIINHAKENYSEKSLIESLLSIYEKHCKCNN